MSPEKPTEQPNGTQAALHTPGPWKQFGSAIGAEGHHYIARMSSSSPVNANEDLSLDDPKFAEQMANARLIAAAPDMLAALKSINEACPCDPDSTPSFNTAWQRIRAAIRKAEGR